SSLADVMKRLPGISIRGVQGRGGEIRMRGLGSGYTQILLNGDRAPPGFSLDSISPELIERIEIARAATADVSAQAIAGSINIILKKKIETARRDLKLAYADTAGQPALSLDGLISDRDGPFSYTVAAGAGRDQSAWQTQTDQQEYDAAGQQRLVRSTRRQDTSQSERLNLAPRLLWNFTDGDSLGWESLLRLQQTESSSHEQRQTSLGEQPLWQGNDGTGQSYSAQLRSKLSWQHLLESGAKLELKLGGSYHQSDSDSTLAAQNGENRLWRTVDASAGEQGVSLSGKYLNSYTEGHAFALGWDGEYSLRNEDNIQREVTQGVASHQLDETYSTRVGRLALFAQDEWVISPVWSAYLGLRWEGIDTQTGQQDAANRSAVLSPILQTLWKWTDKDQLRFAVSRTYKAPNTRDLMPHRYFANDNSATTPDTQGNPALRPELAWGADLGFEHYLAGGGLLSISAYTRRIDDVILPSLSEQNGVWLSQRTNQGQAELLGTELEAKFNLQQYLPDAPALEIRANVAANWSSVDSIPGPDNRLDQQTPLSANLGADYKTGPLMIGGHFNFQSASRTRLSASQTAEMPAKRTLDLYGVWKWSPALQLRLSLANILAQDYLAASAYTDASGHREQTVLNPSNRIARAVLEMKI
ncbi:MAG: TonB-dependent receptor plug domain-containing protein, partial [Iodobacter sp.]